MTTIQLEPPKGSSISFKLKTMLEVQNELNKKLDPEWVQRGFPWAEAIMVEAVELFDHLPWKWWKNYKEGPKWNQVQMEAVDIWHFFMSQCLEAGDLDQLAKAAAAMAGPVPEAERSVDDIRLSVRSLIDASGFVHEGEEFGTLCAQIGLGFDELYKMYLGKNLLNRVRWENDYGKTYIKNWGSPVDGNLEDNEYLASLLDSLDVNALDFKDQVYKGLCDRYEEVKNKAKFLRDEVSNV